MRLLPVAFLLLATLVLAEEPSLTKTTLFTTKTEGYAGYRIPGVVVTIKGTLLAYCEARKSDRGDWGTIDIMLRRSTDGGKTWSEQRTIVTPPASVQKNPVALAQKLATPGEITQNNPVAIVDRDGTIHFLYCIEYARCYYMKSTDDGQTFSPAVDITETFEKFRPEYDWKVLATGPGHGIQLHNGRLLIPVWMSTGTGGHAHRPSCVSVITSDDHGKTWERGEIVVAHPELVNPSETVPVELSDGRVMLNIRHESEPRHRAVSISNDGATNWSPARRDEQLPEPVCMGSIIRYSHGGKKLILFANPHNPTNRDRINVSVKLSDDEGTTWPVMRTLEAGRSGYSDLAVGPDGWIYCFYEEGDSAGRCQEPGHLILAKFNLAWLLEKPDGKAE